MSRKTCRLLSLDGTIAMKMACKRNTGVNFAKNRLATVHNHRWEAIERRVLRIREQYRLAKRKNHGDVVKQLSEMFWKLAAASCQYASALSGRQSVHCFPIHASKCWYQAGLNGPKHGQAGSFLHLHGTCCCCIDCCYYCVVCTMVRFF
jgi:hypothetical protein